MLKCPKKKPWAADRRGISPIERKPRAVLSSHGNAETQVPATRTFPTLCPDRYQVPRKPNGRHRVKP
jgi:hypothetical protein